MNTPNRAGILTKAHRVLKKHYKPFTPPADRPLLEHLLYACCLENSKPDQADQALALLEKSFFDWNEVRVTTVTELAEVMSMLNDPPRAASRLKRSLHAVFEAHYSFDIDFLKKQNLGKSVKEIEKLSGTTRFVVAYFAQHGLAGHSIPLNKAAFNILGIIGAITDKDVAKRRAPGLERAIPKTKGIEFGSLLHQLAVDFGSSPFATNPRSIMLEIAADAKERFPKRAAKKVAKPAAKAKKAKSKKAEKPAPAKKKAPAKAASKTVKKATSAKPTKKAAKKATAKKKKKSPTKRLAKKKPR